MASHGLVLAASLRDAALQRTSTLMAILAQLQTGLSPHTIVKTVR